MRIKKHNNKNEYYLTQNNIWVRNFAKPNVPYVDINKLFEQKEYNLLLENELENYKNKIINVSNENFIHQKVLICSDGYDFNEKHKILSKIPKDVAIIGTHGALNKWRLIGTACPPELRRSINYYVVNNPYQECMSYLPKAYKYYPRCIASTRTNPKFLKSYFGDKLLYVPTPEKEYSGPPFNSQYKIDDYRNPIYAAISLAYRFKARKIMMFCCDASFKENRPASELLSEGFYSYPQQKVIYNLLDAGMFWLKKDGIITGNYSAGGLKFENSTYITEERVIEFFNDSYE